MSLRFAYKKPPTRSPVGDEDVNEFIRRQAQITLPGPAGGSETIEEHNQRIKNAALTAPSEPAPAYPTNIDPNYIPRPDGKVTTTTAPAVPPAVDPALLARVQAPPAIADTPALTPSLSEVGPPPVMITRDKKGRPKQAIGGADAAARRAVEAEAVDEYVPQREPKWRRFLRAAGLLGSMFGGAVSHDPNTVAVAASGLGRTIANPRAADEDWKQRRQAETFGRRKAEATIANLEAQPELKRRALDQRQQGLNQRQQGLDIHGKRVDDIRLKEALKDYNGRDYTPGDNPTLDKYYEDSGLHALPPHKKDDTNQVVWDNGRLLIVGKRSGQASAVTEGDNATPVVDESKAATQSVTIGDQTFEYLTPREAATLEGRAYEGEQNRASREKIAAESQAGQTLRKGMSGGVKSGAINSTVKGAVASLSKFRTLTASIEKQKAYYGDSKEGQAVIQSLYVERDGLERDMKQLYGAYLELDEKGKPKGLKESAYTPAPTTPAVDLTGQQRSVSKWRKQYPKATQAQEAAWKEKVEAAGGTVIP